MELRPKSYQNHVSPTIHKVIMHTHLMLIFITKHPIRFHTKIIPKSSIPAYTIRYYMHIHILHTLNRVLQPSIQLTIQKHGKEHKFLYQSRSSYGY